MKLMLIILLTIAPNLTLASGTSGAVQIKSINQRECANDHDIEIQLISEHANPDLCTNKTKVNLSCTHVAADRMTSLALTAMISGKSVSMWLKGCDAEEQAQVVTLEVHN